MDPRDFYRTAEELAALPSARESNYRSSVSRAYYSVFVTIQSTILSQVNSSLLKQAQLSSQIGHEWLISALLSSKTHEIFDIGKELQILCSQRKHADYSMRAHFQKVHAEDALQSARDIQADIQSFGLPRIVAYLIQHIRDLAQARGAHPPA